MLAKTGQSDFNEDQEPAVFCQVPDIFGAERSWGSVQAMGLFGARCGMSWCSHVPHRRRPFIRRLTRGIGVIRMGRRDEANHTDWVQSGHQGSAQGDLHVQAPWLVQS